MFSVFSKIKDRPAEEGNLKESFDEQVSKTETI